MLPDALIHLLRRILLGKTKKIIVKRRHGTKKSQEEENVRCGINIFNSEDERYSTLTNRSKKIVEEARDFYNYSLNQNADKYMR